MGLCFALLHEPELLILDEPVNGLDPVGIREVRNLLKDLAKEFNVTIFVSSHILSEIQLLCTKIGIINEGRLVEEVSVDDFVKNSVKYLELHVTSPQKAMELLKRKFGLSDLTTDGEQIIRIYDVDPNVIEEINRTLIESSIKVTSMHRKQEDLEEHYIKVIENSSRARTEKYARV